MFVLGPTNRFVPLERKNVTTGATVNFVTGINSRFRSYVIPFICAVATDDVYIAIRTSTDGGSTWASGAGNYKYRMSSYLATNNNAATEIRLIDSGAAQNLGNAAGEHMQGTLWFSGPSRTDIDKSFVCIHHFDPADALSEGNQFVTGKRIATAAINGVQILTESGNFTLFDGTLYGIKDR